MSTKKILPFPPLIKAQLDFLLSNSPLPFRIDRIRSGSALLPYADRFTLCVPFCLDHLKWDVIYNAAFPLAAPDFVFAAEDEGFHPLPFGDEEEKRSSSYWEWNCRDSSRLLNLVNEFREMYSEYQKKRVAELDDVRLKFEISTVLSREGIEVYLHSGTDRPGEVKFSVPLLDFSLNNLVQGSPWKGEQKIHLQVVFPVTPKYSGAPSAPRLKLISSPGLRMLFSIEDVKLPPWVNGMCMAEYLPTIEDNLKVQIMEAVASIGARRRFIEALAPLFGRPVEADPVFCRRASFLVVSGGFTFLMHFALTSQFPRQQPAFTMQSSCHFNSLGEPIVSPPIAYYPWSPRWEPSQMAERIFDFVADECLKFKKHCNDSLPLQP